jgi:hypothetical protein
VWNTITIVSENTLNAVRGQYHQLYVVQQSITTHNATEVAGSNFDRVNDFDEVPQSVYPSDGIMGFTWHKQQHIPSQSFQFHQTWFSIP